MCRLFGMTSGQKPVRASFYLLDAHDSLARQSRRDPDGTGLGWYDSAGRPRRLRDPDPAWKDRPFAHKAHEVRSRTFVAHIRLASTGDLTKKNTHPFLMEGRLLAHNGVIQGLDELWKHIGPKRKLVKGETDSERFMALVSAEADRLGDPGAGLESAARWVAEHLPLYALNIILTTATDLWALRYPETHQLWVLERHQPGRHLDATSAAGTVRVRSEELSRLASVIVASERLTESQRWRQMDSGELLHVDGKLRVTKRIALPDPPKHPLRLKDMTRRAASSQQGK